MQTWLLDEFCRRHGLSRTHFYALKAKGLTPRMFKIGRAWHISEAAERDWVAAQEREAA